MVEKIANKETNARIRLRKCKSLQTKDYFLLFYHSKIEKAAKMRLETVKNHCGEF